MFKCWNCNIVTVHYAKRLCRNCYIQFYRKHKFGICNNCKNSKPITAKGLCRNCYQKDYYHKNKHKIVLTPLHKLKRKARKYAKANFVKPNTCYICNSTKKVEYHHLDYKDYKNKRSVIPLCYYHHKQQ